MLTRPCVHIFVYILILLQCVQFFVSVCVLISSPSVILDLAIPRVARCRLTSPLSQSMIIWYWHLWAVMPCGWKGNDRGLMESNGSPTSVCNINITCRFDCLETSDQLLDLCLYYEYETTYVFTIHWGSQLNNAFTLKLQL